MAEKQNQIPQEIAEMPFEKSIEELEAVVARMENEPLALEALMDSFERGTYLSRHCREMLDAFEKRIEILNENVQGESQWQEFKS